ncbi:MAG TPA: type VI secretion system baseplate subunit TssG [Bordetella sp.]|uniref:type VI secretion system baseplate subunit TssG n=1 Tax=Bordetella sp. TaxID=28081 RepID=UPI002ED4C4FF
MATETRPAAFAVKDDLLVNSDRYAYFQAVRLLQLSARASRRPATLRVRPKLALGFPENDIDSIEQRADGGYRIQANFFGLYGVASPLPTYYTEDLLDEEREGGRVMREFLDIVHYAMYPLLFDVWSKYRLQLRIIEQEDAATLNHLYAFIGLENQDLRVDLLPGSAGLLRYAGLLSQRPRSALGLQTMLADAYAQARVQIDSCVARTVPIPSDQRWSLGRQGSGLGEDAYLGSLIDDYAGNIRLRLTDVPQALFHQLLPGAKENQRLRFLVRFYLIDPCDVEVQLHLRHDDARAARLNDRQWARLGLDTWLVPEQAAEPTQVAFKL